MRVTATLRGNRRTAGHLALTPLNSVSLRDQAYALLKDAIANTDIYSERQPLRLDERELMQALGRESHADARGALDPRAGGLRRTVPRRGIFIIRKSKREIIEMIQMWAALESMSARLATLHAPDAEIEQAAPPVRRIPEFPARGAYRRVLGRQHRLSPDDHPPGRLATDRGRDQESVPARARHSQGHDLAERSCRPLDHRAPENHRSAGTARHRARRAADAPAHARSRRARRAHCNFLD